MEKKKIAITMGDPGGVGPEIVIKAISSETVRRKIIPVVIGSENILVEASGITGIQVEFIKDVKLTGDDISADQSYLIPIDDMNTFKKGEASEAGGAASVECIRKAVTLCMDRNVDAIVTAPISKEALHFAGYSWPGHTEMIAELSNSPKVGMLFIGKSLKVILVTIHVPLSSVAGLITEERVYETILLAERGCRMLSIASPIIGIAGLNPHASEGGLFGVQEETHIYPAIEKARQEGLTVHGPFPPDTVFKRALDGEFDIVVAMYHDQGLIPFKILHFETGVNATIGLPMIRTSPDHGTAYDIAWRGIASPSSMIEALLVAERMKL
jgi:4-hydroxythreonine-4-phosphate dehydrogenase